MWKILIGALILGPMLGIAGVQVFWFYQPEPIIERPRISLIEINSLTAIPLVIPKDLYHADLQILNSEGDILRSQGVQQNKKYHFILGTDYGPGLYLINLRVVQETNPIKIRIFDLPLILVRVR